MLTIRLKRTGRRGHAQYRLVAQDSRFSPSSGRVVAYLGSYNPHTKEATIDGEKVSAYLSNGAQPSDRAAKLLKSEGIKLPDWVQQPADKKREIRNPEKLRRNRPTEEAEVSTEAKSEPNTDKKMTNQVDESKTEAEPENVPDEKAEEVAAETPEEKTA